MANPIIIPPTPPQGSSSATLNAYIALAAEQTNYNNAVLAVANAINADQAAAVQATIAQATQNQGS